MKTKTIMFLVNLLVIIALLIITSCEKDDSIDPINSVIVYEKPQIELSISPDIELISYGEKISISWNIINAKEVYFNNESVDLSDTKEITLFKDSLYSIAALNGDSSTIIEKQFKVGDWTTSRIGLLTYHPWVLKSSKVWQNGNMVWESLLDEEQKTNIFYYHLSGTPLTGIKYDYAEDEIGVYEGYHSSGEMFAGGTWAFSEDGNSLSADMEGKRIASLTKDELILHTDGLFYGKPCIYEETYYRPK